MPYANSIQTSTLETELHRQNSIDKYVNYWQYSSAIDSRTVLTVRYPLRY